MIFRKKAKPEEIIKEVEKRVKRYASQLEIPYIEFEVDLKSGYYKVGIPEKNNGEKRERLNELLGRDSFLSKLHLDSYKYSEK